MWRVLIYISLIILGEHRARSAGRSQERRYSTSSSEDGGELDASLLSLPSNLAPVSEIEPAGDTTRPPESVAYQSYQSHKQSRSRPRLSQAFAPHTTNDTHETVWTAKNSYAFDTRALVKRKLVDIFISLTSLRSYVELNYSGFSKILKKYELFFFKVTGSATFNILQIRQTYLQRSGFYNFRYFIFDLEFSFSS